MRATAYVALSAGAAGSLVKVCEPEKLWPSDWAAVPASGRGGEERAADARTAGTELGLLAATAKPSETPAVQSGIEGATASQVDPASWRSGDRPGGTSLHGSSGASDHAAGHPALAGVVELVGARFAGSPRLVEVVDRAPPARGGCANVAAWPEAHPASATAASKAAATGPAARRRPRGRLLDRPRAPPCGRAVGIVARGDSSRSKRKRREPPCP